VTGSIETLAPRPQAAAGARARQGDLPSRLLIIVENLPVPFDARVWNEATALAAAGCSVSVICPLGKGHHARHEVIDGINIYRHPYPIEGRGGVGYLLEYANALLWQTLLAWRVRRKHGFEVVQGCNPPDTIFLVAGLFKLLFGTRFIFDQHDLSPEMYVAKFGRRGLLYSLLLRLERWSIWAADSVIVSNQSFRDLAIARCGVSPDRIFIVRSGPNPTRIYPVTADPALRNGRRYLIGYVGLISRNEGLQHLLDAAAYIVRDLKRHDVQFSLVGDGPELDRLRRHSLQNGIGDFVTFHGLLTGEALLRVLCSADICVNPDVVNELNHKLTAIKVLEYMALGKPVVQFETTEGRVSAGEAALYARPNDARDLGAKIVELLDDPDRREIMAAAARRRIEEELAWSHQIAPLRAAYATAVE
jgi:glycosyltransferase involved in cell wall biosynthesis